MYPLSPDDPRAQLEPEFYNVPEATLPLTASGTTVAGSAGAAGMSPPDALVSVHYDFETGTTERRAYLDGFALGAAGTLDSSPSDRSTSANLGVLSQKLDADRKRAATGTGSVQEGLVFGTDDRVLQTNTLSWPNRTQVKLFTGWPSGAITACSGTIIDTKYVLTAGHCVKNRDYGGVANWIRAVPALNDTYKPFGDVPAVAFDSVNAWLDNYNSNYDFAMLTLDRKIGNATGWTGFCSLSDQSLSPLMPSLLIGGYPGDLGQGRYLFYATDFLRNFDSTTLYYQVDTAGGQSGAGIGAYARSCPYYQPFGVNRGTLNDNSYNTGTRINNSNFSLIQGWIANRQSLSEIGFLQSWVNLGGTAYYTPTVTHRLNSTAPWDMFITDPNTQSVKYFNGAGSSWVDLGGSTQRRTAAVSRNSGLLDLFMVDSGGSVFTKAWNGSAWLPSQTGWWNLGGNFSGDAGGELAAISWAWNRIDVFAVKQDLSVWHILWDGDYNRWGYWQAGVWWSNSWESIGGAAVGPIAVVSRETGRLSVFIYNLYTASIFTKAWEGGQWLPSQTDWWDLGTPVVNGNAVLPAEGVTAVSPGTNNVTAIIREYTEYGFNGTGLGQVFIKSWDSTNGWGSWTNIGGTGTGRVAAVSRAPGWIDYFARDIFGRMITKSSQNLAVWWPSVGSWTDQSFLGGVLIDASVTSANSSRIDVFARDINDAVQHKWWDGAWHP